MNINPSPIFLQVIYPTSTTSAYKPFLLLQLQRQNPTISIFKRSHSQVWEVACGLIKHCVTKTFLAVEFGFLQEQLAESSLGHVVSAILTLRVVLFFFKAM